MASSKLVLVASAGIELSPARRARAEGADVIPAGCDRARLQRAATELGALTSAPLSVTKRREPVMIDVPMPSTSSQWALLRR